MLATFSGKIPACNVQKPPRSDPLTSVPSKCRADASTLNDGIDVDAVFADPDIEASTDTGDRAAQATT